MNTILLLVIGLAVLSGLLAVMIYLLAVSREMELPDGDEVWEVKEYLKRDYPTISTGVGFISLVYPFSRSLKSKLQWPLFSKTILTYSLKINVVDPLDLRLRDICNGATTPYHRSLNLRWQDSESHFRNFQRRLFPGAYSKTFSFSFPGMQLKYFWRQNN